MAHMRLVQLPCMACSPVSRRCAGSGDSAEASPALGPPIPSAGVDPGLGLQDHSNRHVPPAAVPVGCNPLLEKSWGTEKIGEIFSGIMFVILNKLLCAS